jgi:hypothetical protein
MTIRRLLDEKTEAIVRLRGLSQPDAEREAFNHILIEYLDRTHLNTPPAGRALRWRSGP